MSNPPKKIVFLDVDGVLNSSEFARSERGIKKRKETSFPDAHLDEEAIKRMNTFCKKIGASIVLSSTWREFDDCIPSLIRNGLKPKIIGKTPHLVEKLTEILLIGRTRGEEIQAWLDANKELWDEYIIIDDDGDMLPHHRPHFIHTSSLTGFDEKKLKEALHRFTD